MARIRLEHLTKDFSGPNGRVIRAVDDLSLTVNEGEWLVLVGPSGCGKTTTLRLVAGLEAPTSGAVSFDGKSLDHVPAKQRDIAMVFQNAALYPHLTAYQNMAFGLQIRRCPKTEIAQRVRAAAAMLGLEDCLPRRPMALSGGQRQRVALGRALVRRPGAFLLDEPLANLDLQTRAQLRTELLSLRERLATTLLYVTHDQHEAMTLGHRLGVLNQGVLQQIGASRELYCRPANLFVAGFLGWPPMNLLRGTLSHNAGRLCFILTSIGSPPLSLYVEGLSTPKLQCFIGKPLVLGIRPEDFSTGTPAPGVTLDGFIEAIQDTGPDKYLQVKFGDQKVTARTPSECSARTGEVIPLNFEMRKLRLFDPETEKAIA